MNKKAIQKMKECTPITVPYHVWTCFSDDCKEIRIADQEASLGCDYKSLTQIRAAIQWLAHQFGGHVEWKGGVDE